MEILTIKPKSVARLDPSLQTIRLAAASLDLDSASFNPLNYIVDECFLWL